MGSSYDVNISLRSAEQRHQNLTDWLQTLSLPGGPDSFVETLTASLTGSPPAPSRSEHGGEVSLLDVRTSSAPGSATRNVPQAQQGGSQLGVPSPRVQGLARAMVKAMEEKGEAAAAALEALDEIFLDGSAQAFTERQQVEEMAAMTLARAAFERRQRRGNWNPGPPLPVEPAVDLAHTRMQPTAGASTQLDQPQTFLGTGKASTGSLRDKASPGNVSDRLLDWIAGLTPELGNSDLGRAFPGNWSGTSQTADLVGPADDKWLKPSRVGDAVGATPGSREPLVELLSTHGAKGGAYAVEGGVEEENQIGRDDELFGWLNQDKMSEEFTPEVPPIRVAATGERDLLFVWRFMNMFITCLATSLPPFLSAYECGLCLDDSFGIT
ncbi:hypothetical protein CYMTET_33794 [Cymbomonas tetramitiformis]|uniref:Uncharacterized protein n=1 Tax=Cymbomonas tetramitiformis TaxID=36881 RepID=A0AAE0FC97_9CHLO|nr:hypothetical protein CYMTET_33794 [Cymbomonas tetramitiformis]